MACFDHHQDPRIDVMPQVALADTDAFSGESAVELGDVVRHRYATTGRIARILTGDRVKERGGVAGGACHRPEVVGGPRDRDATMPAHPAVSRLETDDATVGGR